MFVPNFRSLFILVRFIHDIVFRSSVLYGRLTEYLIPFKLVDFSDKSRIENQEHVPLIYQPKLAITDKQVYKAIEERCGKST